MSRRGATVRVWLGAAGLDEALAKGDRPQVTLIDSRLGSQACFEAGTTIRRYRAAGLVILLVARTEPAMAVQARMHGIDAVLTLPLSDQTVNSILAAIGREGDAGGPQSPSRAAA